MERLVCVLIGYCFGLFETALVIGRIKGIDIRKYGSGNLGTTNTGRMLGGRLAVVCFTGDVLKTFAAILIAAFFISPDPPYSGSTLLFMIYAGLGVVLGHNFPFYLKFKGGKGMAVTIGLILLLDWRIALICTAVFVLTFFTTRYMSVGTLSVVSTFLVSWIIFGSVGLLWIDRECLIETYIVLSLWIALCYWQHRSNISRLAHGKEKKLGAH